MSAKTLISVVEFDRLIEPGEVGFELDEGGLIERIRPCVGHNRVVMKITRAFPQYLDKNPAGELFTSDALCVL